jgi:superfamily II DNA or RNA helicase
MRAASSLERSSHRATWHAGGRQLRAALAAATPSPDALRTHPNAALAVMPFQLEPAIAVTRGLSSRLLIADEVGLGKTVQAGLIVSEIVLRRPDGHILIVTPAGLARSGRRSSTNGSGSMRPCSILPTLAHHGWLSSANPWASHPLIITSLDYVKRPEVLRSLEALVWDLVVFDEAHALGGRSDRATAASALAERARTLVLLTATPHSGDEPSFARLCGTGDLQSQFPLLAFRRTREDVGLVTRRRSVSLAVRPSAAEAEMHRAIALYTQLIWTQKGASSAGARFVAAILCRRACSSASSLVRSIERRLALLTGARDDGLLQPRLPFEAVAVDDDEPGVVLSVAGLHDEREERIWLERILALAQRARAGESKLRALRRWLHRANEPAIVFTEYRDTLATVAAALSDRSPLVLHGGLTVAERHDVARQFNSGNASLLLATDAAGEGLNLHRHCRLIINLELPWTPSRLEQRIGRVERIGQWRRVHAVHLLASGTTEEAAVARLLLRSDRVTRAMNDLRATRDSEDDIAEAAIGGRDPSRPVSRRAEALASADLRAQAQVEASRLELVRALNRDGMIVMPDSRPRLTLWRRRHGERGFWIYQLALVDSDGRRLWDTLFGIAAYASPPSSSSRGVRVWLEAALDGIAPAVAHFHKHLQDEVIASLRVPLERAADRERAIVNALTERRARLSAAMLQRGLFDRRAERVAAAQTAVIEDALTRCTARLDEIDRCTRMNAESATLRFVLLRR